jgi:dihydroorotate dehydrogenase
LSNKLIRLTYRKYNRRFVIIGVGGIFSAEDAYAKIRYGANLVELVTGLIFEGPQLIGQINRGLVDLLHKDGFSNVSEAVGVDA